MPLPRPGRGSAGGTSRGSFSRSSDDLKDGKKDRRSSRGSRGSKDGKDELPAIAKSDSLDPDMLARAQATKAQRRSNAMKRMAVGGDITTMMADMSAEMVHGLAQGATPKEKMQRVMIAAKERGLTVPQIFKYFVGDEYDPDKENDDPDYDIEISPPQFRTALQKLCPNVFDVDDAELKTLIDEFDQDGNGTISVVEFRDFCYRIPHLAWKAERLRFEREAEKEGRSVSVSVKPTKAEAKKVETKGEDSPDRTAHSQKAADASVVVREIYSGTKVFWHAKEKLQIKILEVLPPSKPELASLCKLKTPCLALVSYAENARVPHAPLFSDRTQAMFVVKRGQDTLNAASDAAIAKLAAENKGKGVTRAMEDEARLQVVRDSMANQLLVRLKMVNGKPIMQPLGSDSGDAHASALIIDNPGLVDEVLDRYAFETRDEVKFGQGTAMLADIKSGISASMEASRSAERAQKLLSMSMDALVTLRKQMDEQAKLSAGKRRWIVAFRRHFVRQQVEHVRKRLESSPTYHALLAEQAEKRKAAGGK